MTEPDNTDVWPALPYETWKDSLDTLHMWMQIVGKVKLKLVPFLNEWWNVGLFPTARGFTTSTIPYGRRIFQIDLDFIDHRVNILANDGSSRSLKLEARSVADFYREFMSALSQLGLELEITTMPQEVENPIPFDQDEAHSSYNAEYASRCWRVMLQVNRLLQKYRSPFVGKSSPILLWWGSFDLAETRFTGKPAEKKEWPTRWMALAADQEQASAGFWPGGSRLAEPILFAYTAPEPPGCRTVPIRPEDAFFHPELAEFILPYEKVRTSADPDKQILDFYQSTYEAGANLAGWDRATLERR